MNDITVQKRADEYVKWLQSGHKTEISEKTEDLGRRWTKLYDLLIKYPTEKQAIDIYMNSEKVSNDTARRDAFYAQYIFGRGRMPNRNFLIQKNLDRANRLYEMAIEQDIPDPKMIKDSIELINKIIAMIPEEVEPPDMEIYKREIRYSTDPKILGKDKKDIDELKRLFETIKEKTAPKIDFGLHAEDAVIIRN